MSVGVACSCHEGGARLCLPSSTSFLVPSLLSLSLSLLSQSHTPKPRRTPTHATHHTAQATQHKLHSTRHRNLAFCSPGSSSSVLHHHTHHHNSPPTHTLMTGTDHGGDIRPSVRIHAPVTIHSSSCIHGYLLKFELTFSLCLLALRILCCPFSVFSPSLLTYRFTNSYHQGRQSVTNTLLFASIAIACGALLPAQVSRRLPYTR